MSLTIAQWRKLRNLTQAELAGKVGVTANTIRAWERNTDPIKLGQLDKLEEALGVSRDNIIFMPSRSKSME